MTEERDKVGKRQGQRTNGKHKWEQQGTASSTAESQALSGTWVGRRDALWAQSLSPGWSRPMCWQSWRAWHSRSDATLPAGWHTWVGAGSNKGLAWNSRGSGSRNRVSQPSRLAPQSGPPLPFSPAPPQKPTLTSSGTQFRHDQPAGMERLLGCCALVGEQNQSL